MAGRSVLQVLLVAVVFGSYVTQAQDVIRYPPPYGPRDTVVFPTPDGNAAFLSRFNVEEIPPLSQPIRTKAPPRCAMSNGRPISNFAGPTDPCVTDTDYNDNIRSLINRLLVQTNSINEIINDPMLRVILNDTLTVPPAILPQTRFGGVRETPVCLSQEELIFPQRAKTPKDDWVFVLNQDNVKQALRVERCSSEGKECQFGLRSTGEVKTVCRQKYVYRRMLTLGTNNIQPEEVLMPSCCVCYFSRDSVDFATRVGNGNGTFDSEPVSTNQPPAPAAPAAPAAPPAPAPISFNQPARTMPLRRGSTSHINTRSSINRNQGGFNPFYPNGFSYH